MDRDDSFQKNIEDLGKLLPLFAAILAAVYGMGVFLASISDSMLNVGSLSIPKERAIAIGLIFSLFLMPILAFDKYVRRASDANPQSNEAGARASRRRALAWCFAAFAVIQLVLIMLLVGLVSKSQIVSEEPYVVPMLLSSTIPLLPPLLFVGPGMKEFSKASLPLSVIAFISMFGFNIAPMLPAALGGYTHVQAHIEITGGTPVDGEVLVVDADWVVIRVDKKIRRIAKSAITSITSDDELPRPIIWKVR